MISHLKQRELQKLNNRDYYTIIEHTSSEKDESANGQYEINSRWKTK